MMDILTPDYWTRIMDMCIAHPEIRGAIITAFCVGCAAGAVVGALFSKNILSRIVNRMERWWDNRQAEKKRRRAKAFMSEHGLEFQRDGMGFDGKKSDFYCPKCIDKEELETLVFTNIGVELQAHCPTCRWKSIVHKASSLFIVFLFHFFTPLFIS